MSQGRYERPTAIAVSVSGPVAMGAVLGLPGGWLRMLTESLLLPAVVFGVSAVMAPALYIGLSLTSAAPPASTVAGALASGLRACGLVLAGLAPATAFLLLTTQAGWSVPLFGVAVVGAGALLGLRRLFNDLRDDDARSVLRTAPFYTVWALVSLGLGAHFFLQSLKV